MVFASYLKGVPYVKSFRLGEVGEGDAGVTIVEFNKKQIIKEALAWQLNKKYSSV